MKKYLKYISIPLAIAIMVFFSPGSAVADTLGYTTQGVNSDNSSTPTCNKYTAPASGTLTSMTSYDSGTGTVRHAIYSDVAGTVPVNLLAQDSAGVAVSGAGFYTSNVSVAIVSGTTYWLCRWSDTGSVFQNYDANAFTADRISLATYPTWPNPVSSANTATNHQYSIYATYTPTVVPAVQQKSQTTFTGGKTTFTGGATVIF